MSFAADISKFAKKAEVNADKYRRAVCLKLFSAVIMDTPVITGRLRANWNTSVARPDLSVADVPDDGMGKAAATGIAINKIEGNLGTINDPVFLTNNVKYAGYVEYGTPQFDGRFMVHRNVRRIGALMRRK